MQATAPCRRRCSCRRPHDRGADRCPDLGYAAMTAIARHHSAGTDSFGEYRLHGAAAAAASSALQSARLTLPDASLIMAKPAITLDQVLIKPGEFRQMLLYFWIVRMLRLCDGLSQEDNN